MQELGCASPCLVRTSQAICSFCILQRRAIRGVGVRGDNTISRQVKGADCSCVAVSVIDHKHPPALQSRVFTRCEPWSMVLWLSQQSHPPTPAEPALSPLHCPARFRTTTNDHNSGNQHTGESKDCTGTLCIYRGDGARSASLPMRQAIEASRRQANHGSAQHQANTSHPQTRSGVVYNMHIGTPDALARGALSRSIAPRPHPSHASDDSAAHGRHAN